MQLVSQLILLKRPLIFGLIILAAAAVILTAWKQMKTNLTVQLAIPKVNQRADANEWPRPTRMEARFLSLIETSMVNMTHGQLEQLYYSILRHTQVDCLNSRRIGNTGDGGWDVCLSGQFDIRRGPCVAFSFGVNYVYEFDDALADKYHCRVYMFDPSMKDVEHHRRRNTSWFYRIGLADKNYVMPSNGWTMRSLCSLFRQLGYENKPIDILKVDIEHWEWDSFDAALRDGCLAQVKQLMFESHAEEMLGRRSDFSRLIRAWLGLFRAGFRTWLWHENPKSNYFKSSIDGLSRACCYEHYMLNTGFL